VKSIASPERHARGRASALKAFVVSNSPTAVPRNIFVGAPYGVMAGLVPAIHVFLAGAKRV